MANKIISLALDKLVNETKELNSSRNDEDKKAKLEKKLANLINERGELNPQSAEALRYEAAALGRMADYTKHLADTLEKNKKDIEKKKTQEVKKSLMEQLGVPAEFVDQLSILVKAGPEALREASDLYKKESEKKRDMAALITQDIERLDSEIKQIQHIKQNLKVQSSSNKESMTSFLNRKAYEDSIRDKSELELKQALELIEGRQGEKI